MRQGPIGLPKTVSEELLLGHAQRGDGVTGGDRHQVDAGLQAAQVERHAGLAGTQGTEVLADDFLADQVDHIEADFLVAGKAEVDPRDVLHRVRVDVEGGHYFLLLFCSLEIFIFFALLVAPFWVFLFLFLFVVFHSFLAMHSSIILARFVSASV